MAYIGTHSWITIGWMKVMYKLKEIHTVYAR